MTNDRPAEDYRKTKLYREASPELRRKYERWKQEQKLDARQMYLELSLEELKQTPKEEKRKGNRAAEVLVVTSIFFFLIMAGSKSRLTLLIACGMLFINTLIYLSGALNPYTVQLRRVKKQLRAYPQAERFELWCAKQEQGDAR